MVEEDDHAFAGFDHLTKGRPIVAGHDRLGRGVGHVGEPGFIEDRFPDFGYGDRFWVGEDKREDFIGVAVEEVFDFVEVIFDCATIEEGLDVRM